MYSHVYHVDGLLIDTGHPNMRKEVCDTLSDLSVDQMLVTHHHEDHSGNVAAVNQLYDCPVYSSAQCIELMKIPPPISPAQYITWGRYDPYFNFDVLGDTIETSKYAFQVIPIPGHAEDMVALYEKDQGWLFSADLYVHHRIKFFMRAERMDIQIISIKKVLELDFDKMFCSHNSQVISDPKSLLKKKLAYFEDFYGEVSRLYHQGMNAKQILRAMPSVNDRQIRWLSLGGLSHINMIRSVIRSVEEEK